MIHLHGTYISKIDFLDSKFHALVEASARLAKKDFTLWGSAAEDEARMRLNWVDLPETSRDLLPELDALAARFRSHTHVILCGMGGSSLAPEVIAGAFGKKIFILDSTDPQYISAALDCDLSTTVVVVSSKSGSTIETASQRALFTQAFINANLNPADHMVIVTDPDSPLDRDSRSQGFTVVNADSNVGGRFSALTAFGLVPAALMGVDVSLLLDSASDAVATFQGATSPAVAAAYLLSYHADQYLSFDDSSSQFPGISDWIEQLIAESTGKDFVGRLPVVIESDSAPVAGKHFSIAFSGNRDLVVEAQLGAHFIFWEWVTALIGFAIGVDPFNQPNVTEAKNQTSTLLAQWSGQLPTFTPTATDGAVEIFANAQSIEETLTQLIDAVSADGYLAIMIYADRLADRELGQLRAVLASKSERPVTLGWGPRFLHSTGQFHKGGQQNGVFLQITAESENDLEIPGTELTFQTLIMAQALGDAQALSSRDFTVARLHMRDRSEGAAQILKAARAII
ncbi:MAG: hypothetical protein F2704_03920 [Actinobacteria bacterium]|uniref:Unannotated protein n=1 Tax=freshwater metagenome TaxID=449393 RepID=A0A6J6TW33_9ZZZZ|nr:hypothetical protein [Actinomycetota bacterium]MSX24670.1 hypothetical protein [Actinomycetota bacterium]MSY46529.1 hypothetical protein [Actinomycetota bacterium]MSY57403.1 hypothetical protein [Actinomycetota bacterium]MTB00010.1 hypothetical protein [Actinomycetota bacterium]